MIEIVVAKSLETIDRQLCDQFESAWMSGKRPQIETVLAEETRSKHIATLEELIRLDIEYAWRDALNSNDSAIPQLEPYLARFPEINEPDRVHRLQRRQDHLSSLYESGVVAKSNPQAESPALNETVLERTSALGGDTTVIGKPLHAQPNLGSFGDYELLSKLGQGGMGVVYRALQRQANRIVALKVIRLEKIAQEDEDKLTRATARFTTESKATAGIEHDNIMQVYDVGQVGQNLYYSMRFVEGPSLREIIKNGPLENRKAARMIRDAARGMSAAHRNGVLHRDLKPHNIMIDEKADRAVVADFGLAKLLEDDQEVTKTNELVGTPSYMPPEQVRNSSTVNEASDIYSLGASLYQCLTGRPPFQAAHTLATIRQVIYEDPVAPRSLNSQVDRDLATICLKCLRKSPTQRYATAAELADDLERYLEGQPIHARPVGLLEKTVKWYRRNPLSASLTGATLLLALVTFLAVLIGYNETSAALDEAERNFNLARNTVDELYVEASEIDLENAPGMQPLKHKLLNRALAYYQMMINQRGNEADLSEDLAKNHFRVGAITNELKSAEEAERHFLKATQLQTDLLAGDSENNTLRMHLSNSWTELGRIRTRTDDFAGAKDAFAQALELRQILAKQRPDEVEFQRKLANANMNQGLLFARLSEYNSAQEKYDQAQRIRESILAGQPDDTQTEHVLRDYAKGAFNLGVLRQEQQNLAEAARDFQQALRDFHTLVQRYPESLKDQFHLALTHMSLAMVQELLMDPDSAMKSLARAEAHFRQLSDENPKVPRFRYQLQKAYVAQAQIHLIEAQTAAESAATNPENLQTAMESYQSAETRLKQAINELRHLRDHDPAQSDYHFDLAVALHMLGDVQLAFEDNGIDRGVDAARRSWREAQAAMRPLGGEFETVPAYQEQWELLEQSLKELNTLFPESAAPEI